MLGFAYVVMVLLFVASLFAGGFMVLGIIVEAEAGRPYWAHATLGPIIAVAVGAAAISTLVIFDEHRVMLKRCDPPPMEASP